MKIFNQTMKDITVKKCDFVATNDSLAWYLESLLLAYKYNRREMFEKYLHALKDYLSPIVYHQLEEILRFSITLK